MRQRIVATLGAIVTLGNGWWSRHEVEHAVRLVKPSLVIADQRRRELLPAGISDRQIIDVETVRRWGETSFPATPPPASGDEISKLMQFLSAHSQVTTCRCTANMLGHR